jgi:hypothetical protein
VKPLTGSLDPSLRSCTPPLTKSSPWGNPVKVAGFEKPNRYPLEMSAGFTS